MDEKTAGEVERRARAVYEAVFEGVGEAEIGGEPHKLRTTKSGLHYLDLDGLRYIEQNPDKDSASAKLAREGHNILWVIRGRAYVARVMDGTFTDLAKKRS